MDQQRRKNLFRVSLIVLIIAQVVIVDLVCGPVYNRVAPKHGMAFVEYHLGNTPKLRLKQSPHPYMLTLNTPGLVKENVVQHNSMGYRGPELSKDSKKKLRILAVGGSTTYGTGVGLPSQAWPSQLQSILEERSARDIEVINDGIPYGTSAELLSHYIYRNRYLGASFVVIHTGGNDSAPLLFDNYDPEYTHFRPGWSTNTLGIRPGEKFLLRHSNIIKLIYAYWMSETGLPQSHLVTRPFISLNADRALIYARKNEPVGFKRNLDLLIRNIIADGAQPVLFKHARASAEQMEVLVKRSKMAKRLHFIYPALTVARLKNLEVMEELAEKYAIPLIEIIDGHMPIDFFEDHTHLNVKGHRLKASLVADALMPFIK